MQNIKKNQKESKENAKERSVKGRSREIYAPRRDSASQKRWP